MAACDWCASTKPGTAPRQILAKTGKRQSGESSWSKRMVGQRRPGESRSRFQRGANNFGLVAGEHVAVGKRGWRIDKFGSRKRPGRIDQMTATFFPITGRRQLGSDQVSFIGE